jgi:hypothetical protein
VTQSYVFVHPIPGLSDATLARLPRRIATWWERGRRQDTVMPEVSARGPVTSLITLWEHGALKEALLSEGYLLGSVLAGSGDSA